MQTDKRPTAKANSWFRAAQLSGQTDKRTDRMVKTGCVCRLLRRVRKDCQRYTHPQKRNSNGPSNDILLYLGDGRRMQPRDVGFSLRTKANATMRCWTQPRTLGECDHKIWDSAMEVRRMQRDVGFSLESFAVKRAPIFANVSHQTRLDTRSKARRPIKVGDKGKVGNEPRLEPCLSMLLIGSLGAI